MKEAYISYEVAKLLKEKGFDEATLKYYIPYEDGEVKLCSNSTEVHYNTIKEYPWMIAAPTHQMACKWLRKEHNILLFLLPAQEDGKLVYLVEVWTWNEEEGIYESTYAPMPRKEPEQSIEVAIKYLLENLI